MDSGANAAARAAGEQADGWTDVDQADVGDVVPGKAREQAEIRANAAAGASQEEGTAG